MGWQGTIIIICCSIIIVQLILIVIGMNKHKYGKITKKKEHDDENSIDKY